MNLKCDEPLSNVAFNFNVRRYTLVLHGGLPSDTSVTLNVGRCRLPVSKPVLKAPRVSEYSLEARI